MATRHSAKPVPATWSILTPPAAPGAIAIIEITAPDRAALDGLVLRLKLGPLKTGTVCVRNLLGIDTGVAARWSDTCLHLMPHGGIGIVRALSHQLTERAVPQRSFDETPTYPEARTAIEQRMLGAVARAASPLAIDLLLDQPRRWASGAARSPELDRVLNRLIDPPLVAAIGPPNIGKSTLANALAGRTVAIVADQPGTTRDHVGVVLDLGGLVVRYLDTPGLRDTLDVIERESQSLALQAASAADLILLMGDPISPPPDLKLPAGSVLRIALRADLGPIEWGHDLAVSARTGAGIAALAAAVRSTLVPDDALFDPRPWGF